LQQEPSKTDLAFCFYLAPRTTIGCRPKADLRRADLKRLLNLYLYRRLWNLRAEPRSQPFNRSSESRDHFLTGIWSSSPDREAKRCVYVPKAEIPKEHLRAIDKDHEVHGFSNPALPDLV
jgi:hypothetical protein